MEHSEEISYSREVIEFTAVANEYCAFLESEKQYNGIQLLMFMQRILPLLYLKVLSVKQVADEPWDDQERFVNEAGWQFVNNRVLNLLGEANDFLEVFEEGIEFSEEGVASGIAENLSDIYQDLKDYLVAYSTGTNEMMSDAIWYMLENFRLYWGQKLVNTLRAVHNALKSPEKIGPQQGGGNSNEIDTSDWIISRKQKEYGEGEEDDEGV